MSSQHASTPEGRRTGRRPGPSTTREEILAAARDSFAKRGYDATSLRAVASRAGVDPALVRRFFGSKEDLFIAALESALRPGDELAEATAGDVETMGARLIGYMFNRWERAPTNKTLVGLVRSAATNEQAAKLLRNFVTKEIFARIVGRLGPDEAELRASLVGSQIIGIAFYRYILKIQPLASAPPERLQEIYAPTLQRYLTGELPPSASPRRRTRS
jgi:AcrR family transcriptional regulator